jgi:small-conductance mechanosensitive channel
MTAPSPPPPDIVPGSRALFDSFTGLTPARVIERTALWLAEHYQEILIALIVGGAIYALLTLVKRWANARVRTIADPTAISGIALRALGKTGHIFIFMVALRLVSLIGNAPPTLGRLVQFFFTIAIVVQAAIWVREILLGAVRRQAVGDGPEGEALRSALGVIRIVASIAIFAVAGIVILDNIGVNVTGLIAGLGIGGIAIGLAAQGIFADLFAALSIILDRPFAVGETIRFDQTTGTVEKIGLKSTRIRALSGEEVIVSNTNLLAKEIINFTRLQRRRSRFAIGVVYQTSPDAARQIPALLQEIVTAQGGEFIRCGFTGFGTSSLDFILDFDCLSEDFEAMFAMRHAIGLAILARFKAERLEFAYPTQTTFTAAPDGQMIMPFAAPLKG